MYLLKFCGIRFGLLAIILLTLSVIRTEAQIYPVQKFTEDDGLCHSNVYRIFQDSRGFLWFGTEYGISRYDGNKFVNYFSTGALSLNSIMAINELSDGRKIVCTYRGNINIIDDDTLRPVKKNFESNLLCIIYALQDGKDLWIITKSGSLYVLSEETIREIKLKDKNGLNVSFRKMNKSRNNILYFATNSGIYCYKSGKFLPFMEQEIHEMVYAIAFDNNDNIWAGMQNEVVKISNDLIINKYSTGLISEISDMIVDRNGNPWVAIPKIGVLVLNDNSFQNITGKLQLQNILINELYEDKTGNIWIATHGSGLYCICSTNITNFPIEKGKINNYANALTYSNGKVFIGSIGTISVFDGSALSAIKINHLSPVEFIYFIKNIGAELYIGTPKGIIVKTLRKNGSEKFINSGGALACLIDKSGNFWTAQYSDAVILKNEMFINAGDHKSFYNKRVNCICEDHTGAVFFGTDSGIVILAGEKYSHLNIGQTYFTNKINAILEDKKNRLWIATDWGTFMIDKGVKNNYSTSNGLLGNRCTSLAEDNSGNIWIGTLTGLNKYDGMQFSHFDSRSGLNSSSVLSLCTDNRQNLWIGTVNGVSKLSYSQINSDTLAPKVCITLARIPGKNLNFPSDVTLAPGDKFLQIAYSGIEFPRADKVEYQYKIEPLNSEWRQTSGNEIELSALPPGAYTFFLRARHIGYAWNINAATLKINVLSPFWKKSWFFIFTLSLIIFFMYRGLRYLILKKEREKREKTILGNKMIYLKQQALNAMINPHFVFNCLNSIQSYIYSNNKEQANRFLVKFSKLIRMTLEHGQDAFISLEKEISRLDLYLNIEQLRFEDKLSYEFDIDQKIIKSQGLIPNMILQPFVENAIKHGIMPKKKDGLIKIAMKMVSEDEIIVVIEDNGNGFRHHSDKNNEMHHSLGMKLTDERLSILNKLHNKVYRFGIDEIIDASGSVTGTRVELMISLMTGYVEVEEV
jgi:ligand-binding sensor domain-containing protein